MSAGDGAPHTSHWLRTTENTPGQFLSLSRKTPMVQITHTHSYSNIGGSNKC